MYSKLEKICPARLSLELRCMEVKLYKENALLDKGLKHIPYVITFI